MRVCFLINDLSGGGAEKALQLLSSYLASNGHDVHVVTLEGGEDAYDLDARICRHVLRSSHLARGVGKIVALPVQARELTQLFQELQPDVRVSFLPRANIAHVLTRWFGNEEAILLSEQASSAKAYPTCRARDSLMRYFIKRSYPKADAVFPSSLGVLEGLRGFGVSDRRMHVMPNPIELSSIHEKSVEPPSHPLHPSELLTVITIGRLSAEKDHETLIRAFAIVRRRVPARLVMVGTGPLRTELAALADRLGLGESISFAGWQSNPYAWLAQADVFVLTSRHEGFGNVIVEAMACGLPIICTDCVGGPREILRSGKDGILVPVGDVNALADAMTRVLLDDALRRKLSERSRKRAPDFDISVIGPQYEQLLISFARKVACVDNFSESFVP